jgi:hypothetical protein
MAERSINDAVSTLAVEVPNATGVAEISKALVSTIPGDQHTAAKQTHNVRAGSKVKAALVLPTKESCFPRLFRGGATDDNDDGGAL